MPSFSRSSSSLAALKLTFGPLRNGDAGGYFLEATLADGKTVNYSVELPTE